MLTIFFHFLPMNAMILYKIWNNLKEHIMSLAHQWTSNHSFRIYFTPNNNYNEVYMDKSNDEDRDIEEDDLSVSNEVLLTYNDCPIYSSYVIQDNIMDLLTGVKIPHNKGVHFPFCKSQLDSQTFGMAGPTRLWTRYHLGGDLNRLSSNKKKSTSWVYPTLIS